MRNILERQNASFNHTEFLLEMRSAKEQIMSSVSWKPICVAKAPISPGSRALD